MGSPPPAGTPEVIGGRTYYYYPPNVVSGILLAPDNLEGVYTVIAIPQNSAPTSFPDWDFTCAWHTPILGIWSAPAINGYPAHSVLLSACIKVPVNVTPPSIAGNAEVGQTLTGNRGTWNDVTSYDYRWRRCDASGNNCSDISGATDLTYVVQGSDVDSTLRLRVTGDNAMGDSATASSAQTAVVVGPPAGGSVTITPTASPVVGPVTLTATTPRAGSANWLGAPASFTFQWERTSTSGGGSGCNNSWVTFGETHAGVAAGATTTDQLTNAAAPFCYRVRVLGVNSHGSSPLVTSNNTVRVNPPAPFNTLLPAISGSTVRPSTLSTTNGNWNNGPITDYDYQWQRSTSGACTSWQDAGGTDNNQTYALVSGDVGRCIRVIVNADNGSDNTNATSLPVGPVTNQPPPANTVLPAITGTAMYGRTLQTSDGTWNNGPITDYDYQWQRSTSGACTSWQDAGGTDNNQTYTLVSSDSGRCIRVIVNADNGVANTNATSSGVGPVIGAPSGSPVTLASGGSVSVQGGGSATVTLTGASPLGGTWLLGGDVSGNPSPDGIYRDAGTNPTPGATCGFTLSNGYSFTGTWHSDSNEWDWNNHSGEADYACYP